MISALGKYKKRMEKISKGMRDCELCFELAHLNEEGECITCQLKILKGGVRSPKQPATDKEIVEFEHLKLKVASLLGKLSD